jgi:hypothetical protein
MKTLNYIRNIQYGEMVARVVAGANMFYKLKPESKVFGKVR